MCDLLAAKCLDAAYGLPLAHCLAPQPVGSGVILTASEQLGSVGSVVWWAQPGRLYGSHVLPVDPWLAPLVHTS